ncbi:hypothetical protein HDV02_001615 [Globomyces sp. JEL0801]|nr:hypothetical protein HDV02_001615 [Globomyces sp. JEL0801]
MVAIMAIKVHGKDSHAGRSIYNGLTFSAVGTAYYSNEEKHSLSLIGVVATVFWKAIDASLATGHAESVLGALVLAISDFILGYSQFVGPIKNGQLLFMVTFYLSQILISKFALNNKLLY